MSLKSPLRRSKRHDTHRPFNSCPCAVHALPALPASHVLCQPCLTIVLPVSGCCADIIFVTMLATTSEATHQARHRGQGKGYRRAKLINQTLQMCRGR